MSNDTASLTMRPEGEVEVRTIALGLGGPFVLVEMTLSENGAHLHTEVTTGGGVPQDAAELVAYLHELADMIEGSLP